MLETCLSEVKHKGELKLLHSETLACGRLLHSTIHWRSRWATIPMPSLSAITLGHCPTGCGLPGLWTARPVTVDMPGLHPTGPSGLPPTEQPYHCPTAQQDTTHPPVHRHTRPPLHQATACWPTVPPPTHWTTGTLAATHHRRAPTPPDAFTKPA
jgi:hypothetical protein